MRYLKILAVILLSSCLLLSSGVHSFATEISDGTLCEAEQIINQYKGDCETVYTIQSTVPLIGFSGNVTYTLYLLHPYGYVILLDETMSFMEGCYSENSCFCISSAVQSPVYYGGPGVYCIIEDDRFYNLATDEYLLPEEINTITSNEFNASSMLVGQSNSVTAQTALSGTTRGTATTYSVAYDYFSSHTDFGDNEDGTCTVIAAQMLLNYYDNYVNDLFIPTIYEKGNGSSDAFHLLLNAYVYGYDEWGGIHIHDAAPGINTYLLEQGFHYGIEVIYLPQQSVLAKIVSTLQGGRPVIASMGTDYGANWNHSVLIYSVTYTTATPTLDAVYTMNMGWRGLFNKKPEYKASASWFYACGYMQDYSITHTLGFWRDRDSCYHVKECANCAYYESGRHADSWNFQLNKCMTCTREGSYAVELQSIRIPSDRYVDIEEVFPE